MSLNQPELGFLLVLADDSSTLRGPRNISYEEDCAMASRLFFLDQVVSCNLAERELAEARTRRVIRKNIRMGLDGNMMVLLV